MTYQNWLDDVRNALHSINMPMDDWQNQWPFNFSREYNAGTKPAEAAAKANRHWWHEQNRSLKQECKKSQDCWLPGGHQGECQPEL